MRSQISSFLHFILPVLMLGMSPLALAGRGGAGSGGGDLVASDFVRVGAELCKMFKAGPQRDFRTDDFCRATQTTRVVTRSKLVLRGYEVDAINTPKKKLIKLSRKRWASTTNLPRQKYVLVAHEYFGIMGLDDSNYQLSGRIFATPGVPLISYRCDLFEILQSSEKIFLKADIYRDLVDLRFLNGKDDFLADQIEAFASFRLNELETDETKMDTSVLVSVNMGLATRLIELPYAGLVLDRGKTRDIRVDVVDISTIKPLTPKRSHISCTVARDLD